MAADPRIILGIQGPTPQHELDTRAATAEESRLKRQQLREASLDQAALRQAMAQYGDDPEQAVSWLNQRGRAGAAATLQEHLTKLRKAAADSRKAELDADESVLKRVTSMASAVNASNYGAFREQTLREDETLAPFLPEQFDPTAVEKLWQMLAPASTKIEMERKALEDMLGGKWDDTVLGWLRNTASQEDRDEAFASLQAVGAPKSVINRYARFQQFTPESAAEIERLMIDPAKTADLAGQAEGRNIQREGQQISAETTRRGQTMSAQTAANRLAFDRSQVSAETGGQSMPAMVEAVMKNPALFKQLTPTVKSRIAPALAERGFKFDQADTSSKGPNVAKIVDEIDTLSKRINTTAGGVGSVVSGWLKTGEARAQYNNDVSEYTSLIEGMIPMVARAVGHTGVLTQQDVESVRALFPKVGENKSLAENKMKRVRSLLGGEPSGTPNDAPNPTLRFNPATGKVEPIR